MTDSDPAGQSNPSAAPSRLQAAAASPAVQSAARWFWWIAGLSIINTVLLKTGTHTNMVVGLGVTLLSDVVLGPANPVGFAVDVIVLAFFLVMGRQAQRGQLWAFYAGMAAYGLDALIYLRFRDWVPVAFHALVIYFIARGVMVLGKAQGKAG